MALVAIVAGYVMLRLQDVLPLNQGGIAAQSPDLAFNTAVSFETNTNWQNYSGESGASHLIQSGMLAVRNFTSAAIGLAVAIALFRGLVPASVAHDRQLLGRPDPRRAVPAAADLDRRRARARVAGRPADVGPVSDHHDPPGHGADDRPRPDRLPGVDQGAGHQRRRLPQRELRPPVREPDGAHQLARDVRDPGHPVRADLHVRPLRRQTSARAGRSSPRWRSSSASARSWPWAARQAATRCSPRASTRRSGNMEGKEVAVRCRGRRPVGRRHHRHEHGRRQRDARQPLAHRRARPDVQHAAGRDHPGRRRRRACTGCSSSARSSRCSSPG